MAAGCDLGLLPEAPVVVHSFWAVNAHPPPYTVVCRVWSFLVNEKLMALTDNVLPDTMFGFRAGRACADPLFILRHLRKHMPAKQRVFAVAFMDLSGAYDSVDRELLFWKLEHQLWAWLPTRCNAAVPVLWCHAPAQSRWMAAVAAAASPLAWRVACGRAAPLEPPC
jgi:hypothetical protein